MKKSCYYLSIVLILLISGNRLFAQCCNFTYQQQVEPPTSAATFGVALGDFDNDGDQDVAAISAYYGIDVYFNNGSGTFMLNAQYATGTNADFYGVHVCDVDGDGDKDIIAIPFYSSASLTVLKNNGSGVFLTTSFSSNIATYYAAAGDIDGDNDIDVFLPNASGGSGKIFKNNGTGSYTLFQTLPGARGHDAELGDIDGDGDLDAFVVENSNYGNTVFLNDGAGTFTQLGTAFGADGSNVSLGDLDGDGDLDAWIGKFGNASEIWTNNGIGTFILATTINTGSYCKGVELYDKDGDGDLDVFMGFYSSAPQIWTNNGNLSFSLCYQAPVGSSSHGQAIGFVNNDSYIDIYSGYFSNDDGDYVFLGAATLTATIEYKDSPFCSFISNPQVVTQTGSGGGTYSASPAGLSINNTNGDIIPSASTPGTYVVSYTVSGCIFNTTVEVISLDTSLTLVDPLITANQSGGTYQWVDCNNGYSPVTGQTGQSFIASANGDYAVVITYNGCIDTSSCVNIVTVGMGSAGEENVLQMYPNPATGIITVNIPASLIGESYSILDLPGRNLLNGRFSSESTRVDISSLPAGLYLLKAGSCYMVSLKVQKHR